MWASPKSPVATLQLVTESVTSSHKLNDFSILRVFLSLFFPFHSAVQFIDLDTLSSGLDDDLFFLRNAVQLYWASETLPLATF